MLRRFVAPEIVFGRAARRQVAAYAKEFHGEKILIVSDPGVIAAGWLRNIQADLDKAHISWALFSDVSPNPRASQVANGADFYRDNGCDMIVAVGGGSPMDCAKAIGAVASSASSVFDFEGVDRIYAPMPPMILVPTTAGTSADVSQFAIINNETERYKFAIISKSIVPSVALIDPDTTTTMDSYLTACTGVDAMVHAIEAFVSTGAGPLTDLYALDAIDLINRNLPIVHMDPSNNEARDKVMEGSMKAGLAFSNAMLGAVHAMAHSLGGYLDLAHGECNAMLLDHVIAYNFPMAPERYTRIALQLGLPTSGLSPTEVSRGLLDYLRSFKKSLGINRGLAAAGVRNDDIRILSNKAMSDPCLLTNPRPARESDISTIFREAL